MKAKNSGDYYNLAKEVVYSEYEKAEPTKLTRAHVNLMVCNKLKEEKPDTTTKKTQPSVHRALEALVKEKVVFLHALFYNKQTKTTHCVKWVVYKQLI